MDLKEAINVAYAKSTGETIKQHTDALIERLKKIREIRGDEIVALCPEEWKSEFWNLAEIIIQYHDYGKLHSPFQKRLIETGNLEERYELIKVTEAPHNFLSPCFLPEDVLKRYEKILPAIVQAIAYHHERDIDTRRYRTIINEVAEKDLSRFQKPLFLKFWQYIDPKNYISPKSEDRDLFRLLILLKGLLHRADYTASGDIDSELKPDCVADKIKSKLEETGNTLTEMQNFVLKNNNSDLLVVAPTGSGKTEAGALYIDQSKGFFILPLRVSIDSIYDRFTGNANEQVGLRHGIKNVGLMHSNSLFKLMGDIYKNDSDVRSNAPSEKNFDQIFRTEQEAKNLSFPLSITTPDQIFPFVFKYGGFERVYFTLGYSKIVIDEIQMYNPRMLAYTLKGLQAIKELGGKIMIMTATFPEFLKSELAKLNITFNDSQIFKTCNLENFSKVRHHVKLEMDKDIFDKIEDIKKNGIKQKVLVICNTVNKAIDVYNRLGDINKYLLHSRFIQKHRRMLEEDIQNFAPNDSKKRDPQSGIWITTQIAEVSLNIDFDILYTELSSIDSLIQRMGRVNRSGRNEPKKPNVIICCKKKMKRGDTGCSGIGNIYDEVIFDLTGEYLAKGKLKKLDEFRKMELVEKIYSFENIKGTGYYSDFEKSLNLISEIWEVGKIYNPIESLRQAQKQFREVFTITLIPQKIFSDNINFFEDLKSKIMSKNLQERICARKNLMDYTVSIPYDYVKMLKVKIVPFINDVYIAPFKYDFDEASRSGTGLLIDKLDESNLWD